MSRNGSRCPARPAQPGQQGVHLGAGVEEGAARPGRGGLLQGAQQRLRGRRAAVGALGEQGLEQPGAHERGRAQWGEVTAQHRLEVAPRVGRPAPRARELRVEHGEVGTGPEPPLGPGDRLLRPVPLTEAEAHPQLVRGGDRDEGGRAPAVGQPPGHPVQAVQRGASLQRLVERDDRLDAARGALDLDVRGRVEHVHRDRHPGRRLLGPEHLERGPAREDVGVREGRRSVPAARRGEGDRLLRGHPGRAEVVLGHEGPGDEVHAVHLDRRQLRRPCELHRATQVVSRPEVLAREQAQGTAVGEDEQADVGVEVGREVRRPGIRHQRAHPRVGDVGREPVAVQHGRLAQRGQPGVGGVVGHPVEGRDRLVGGDEVALLDREDRSVDQRGRRRPPVLRQAVDGPGDRGAHPGEQEAEPLLEQDALDERDITGSRRVVERGGRPGLLEEPLGRQRCAGA